MYEETLDAANQKEGDTKEGLYFGREVAADSPEADLPLHGPNQWPPQVGHDFSSCSGSQQTCPDDVLIGGAQLQQLQWQSGDLLGRDVSRGLVPRRHLYQRSCTWHARHAAG